MHAGGWRVRVAAVLAGLVPVLLAGVAARADPDALWRIVHGRCVPDQADHADPAPCAAVSLSGGWAVLKDLIGNTQYLLIPTARVTGIEDPAVLAEDAPDWFAAAWDARRLVTARLGHDLPRGNVSLAVNAPTARSQEQLHVHVDCLRANVAASLAAMAPRIGAGWAPLPGSLPEPGAHWMAMQARSLEGVRPFAALADGLGARGSMGEWTLVVTGSDVGGPGFLLLAEHVDLAAGERGSGELLQDHGCAVGRSG